MGARHLLTELQVRNAKPGDKARRLHDGGGLYLRVGPTGTRSWQFRYWQAGKCQTASIGKLEHWKLSDARREAERLAALAARGEHLTSFKRVERAAKHTAATTTFCSVVDSWMADAEGWTETYRANVRASIDNHLSELLPIPVDRITAAMAKPLLDKAAKAAPRLAPQVRQRLHSILDFALESGLIAGNPLPSVRRRPRPAKNHPAVTTREGVGAILRAAAAANPPESIARAHALLVFTAQRIGNCTQALWSEFDLDAGVWEIPRAKMKARKRDRGPHLVPLPPHLLAKLRQWRTADGDGARFVCPGLRGGDTLSDTRLQDFYRDDMALRGTHRPHSWRAVLKTWAGDAGKSSEAVEQQLDHTIGNSATVAYDRADRLGPRRDLMTWYEGELLAASDAVGGDRLIEQEQSAAHPLQEAGRRTLGGRPAPLAAT